MSHTLRIGSAIDPVDPYWVQVRVAAYERAEQLPFDLISISLVEYPETLSQEKQMTLLEELLALELDALIAWSLPEELLSPSIPYLHSRWCRSSRLVALAGKAKMKTTISSKRKAITSNTTSATVSNISPVSCSPSIYSLFSSTPSWSSLTTSIVSCVRNWVHGKPSSTIFRP
jgi:hypothetical protein